MSLIDISRNLEPNTAVWPGDTPYQITKSLEIERGDSVNLTTLTLSAHTATHIDAPLHFSVNGQAIGELDLRPYWGLAQVVAVEKQSGPLYPDDFAGYDLGHAPRLLVRSPASNLAVDVFPEAFVYPSPELADYLSSLGIVLYGTDAPSMDHEQSVSLDGHHALYRNGIALLEWLDLSRASAGLYELAALPLKIIGGDGSPVRAVLQTIGWSQVDVNGL